MYPPMVAKLQKILEELEDKIARLEEKENMSDSDDEKLSGLEDAAKAIEEAIDTLESM